MNSFYTQAVNEYYVDIFRENAAHRRARLAALGSPEEARAYRDSVRAVIRSAFALPSVRTPLNLRSVGRVTHVGFHIDKVLFESRPGDFVSANIYVPDVASQPMPGVLFLCGHSGNGKASDTYQHCCITLALNGCVVFTFDPSGQGERELYIDGVTAKDMHHIPTWQHNMIARQFDLLGESYASWCLFDAMRALDCLETLPGVDRSRLFVTGNSGGGNMAAFLTAVDDRLAAVAPSCYLTTWEHNVENELPCCAEQEPPGLVGLGCEMGDLLIAAAPRPQLLLGQQNDFFDPRGTRETFQELQRFYALLGCPDNVECFIGPRAHGYHLENRQAMYDFVKRVFALPKMLPEPDPMPLTPEAELLCTPEGQVGRLPGFRHPRDFIRERSELLAAAREARPWKERLADLKRLVRVERVTVPHYRVLRPLRTANMCLSRFGLESEPRRLMSILYRPYDAETCFHIAKSLGPVTLFVPHRSVEDEIPLDAGPDFFALDVRGVGALTPGGCDLNLHSARELHPLMPPELMEPDQLGRNAFAYYNYDYHAWACGIMSLDYYQAGRVRDLLAALCLLQTHGASEITLRARGQGVITAALAAVCFTAIPIRAHFTDIPPSFCALCRDELVCCPHSGLLHGILKITDLPELYRRIDAALA